MSSIKYGQYPFEYSTLLPPNASPLERRLEQIFAHRLGLIEPDILRITKDPEQTPLALLPWLAWENSVDWWNDNWPEDLKRNWTAKSVEIHMKKGTPRIVEQSLEYLGLQAEWIDFWKYADEGVITTNGEGVATNSLAGTFRMKVFRETANEAYLGLWDVEQIINATKTDTRQLDKLTLGVSSKITPVQVAAGHGIGVVLTAEPYTPKDLTAQPTSANIASYSELIIILSPIELTDVNYPAEGDH